MHIAQERRVPDFRNVGLKPDMLVAMTTPATAALQAATRTIPIVFAAVSDPVGSGFAAFTDKW